MELYTIVDLDKFLEATRTLVYNYFGEKEEPIKQRNNLSSDEIVEMDLYLSQKETKNISKKFIRIQKNKNTGEIRYIISEENYFDFVEELNTRMVSNMLSNLASQGILETAFDEEKNDFVFWLKENEKN